MLTSRLLREAWEAPVPTDVESGSPRNFAERYETFLVPVIFVPWAREMTRRAAPRDGEHVLDLACGTGVVTRTLARSGALRSAA